MYPVFLDHLVICIYVCICLTVIIQNNLIKSLKLKLCTTKSCFSKNQLINALFDTYFVVCWTIYSAFKTDS